MVVVPADKLLTTPVEALIVATAVLLLVQVPPVFVLANVEDTPKQTEVVPVIGVVGITYAEQVPVVLPVVQLEVVLVSPKFTNVPLYVPVASVKEVIPALFAFTAP